MNDLPFVNFKYAKSSAPNRDTVDHEKRAIYQHIIYLGHVVASWEA